MVIIINKFKIEKKNINNSASKMHIKTISL